MALILATRSYYLFFCLLSLMPSQSPKFSDLRGASRLPCSQVKTMLRTVITVKFIYGYSAALQMYTNHTLQFSSTTLTKLATALLTDCLAFSPNKIDTNKTINVHELQEWGSH